jgi:hypothetical protein
MSSKANAAEKQKITVQTLRLNMELYKRLAHYAVDSGRTHQEIMGTALVAYLDKMKA